MSTLLSSMIFPLFLLLLPTSIINSIVPKYRVNRDGVLFFFYGETGFDWATARRLCQRMGGRLPYIHKMEDVSFLKELTGTAVWLGGQRIANGSYAWNEGSAFNFAPWYPGEPDCSNACCGIFLTKRYPKIAAQTCDDSSMPLVCQLDQMSRMSDGLKMEIWGHELSTVSEEVGSLEQSMQNMADRLEKRIEEAFQRAINSSDEKTQILVNRIEKIVQDFKGTIDSLERLIIRNGLNVNNNDLH